MSKATKRRAARGERWLTIDRQAARRLAFEEGMRLCEHASFRNDLIAGKAPNWHRMAILTTPEKEKIRADVLAFAKATEAERAGAFKEPAKKGLRERVKEFFSGPPGA